METPVRMKVNYDPKLDITKYMMFGQNNELVKVRFHFGEEIALDLIADDNAKTERDCDIVLKNINSWVKYEKFSNEEKANLVIETILLTYDPD